MRKQIKVVIGANFGDEGKGLMTDYFCDKLSKSGKVLNVRHNGGAQAGHTVVTPDGKRHVFSHFGAGSFNPHVATYLSKDFIINPMVFCKELKILQETYGISPAVYVHPDCRVTTHYDMIINQLAEISRGDNRHGSCGLGINETIVRIESDPAQQVFRAKNLSDIQCNGMLWDKLMYIKSDYLRNRLSDLGVPHTDEFYESLINSQHLAHNFVADFLNMMSYCSIMDDEIFNQYENIVFEGAQGLLLDNDYLNFAPHLTSSKTGSYNPKRMILKNFIFDADIEFCYVTRSYFTRHGAGQFPTECPHESILPESCVDKTNVTNDFQGHFRYGYFDEDLFQRTVLGDIIYLSEVFDKSKITIAVTHLDETDDVLVTNPETNWIAYDGIFFHSISPDGTRITLGGTLFHVSCVYKSYGETRENIVECTEENRAFRCN